MLTRNLYLNYNISIINYHILIINYFLLCCIMKLSFLCFLLVKYQKRFRQTQRFKNNIQKIGTRLNSN